MYRLIRFAEIVLGIIFLGAGVNGYLVLFGFQPIGPTSPGAMEFLGSGYFLALEKGVEIIAGILLLAGWFVPLTLMVLAGLIINILAFHLFVDADSLILALFITVLEGILLWSYRESFRGLLERKSNPTKN